MAPTKPSPLKALRKQSAARNQSMATASAGSAFSRIARSNEAFKYGFKRTYDDLDGKEQEVFADPAQKRVRRAAPKKVIKRAKATPRPPPEPVVESWRPAGGDESVQGRKAGDLTDTLGLARVSTWRVEAFQSAAEALIEQKGFDFVEVTAVELEHGGESVTDVFMKFRSEIVAELVRDVIDGEMVEGRKLQARFA
ncbi:hypothetical protein LTR08_007946 [Meristemomyces frigidus]|nr:hypothetical protein LTR08_007946 [Meristemomyces frigidus]